MASGGNVDFRELQEFRRKMEASLNDDQINDFIESCAKELAARLLAKVIKRTPVGQYPASTGKKAVHFAGVGLVEKHKVERLMLIHCV